MTRQARVAVRSRAERDRLVEQYLPLVRHVAARMPVVAPASMSRDDFFSAGLVGLMHAAAQFDETRGASFKTFAFTAVRGAILDEIRRHDPVSRGRRDRLRQWDRASEELRAELGREPTIPEIADAVKLEEAEVESIKRSAQTPVSLEKPVVLRGAVRANCDYVGAGYGVPTDGMVEALKLLAQTEGLLFDPVYSGKALDGLIDQIRQGYFDSMQNVVFLHTGGSAGLFGYPDIFDLPGYET